MRFLALPSYAKINLSLRVVSRRPDGYHEIETIMAKVSLHDTLYLSKEGKGFTITTDRDNLPLDEENTVVRAYHALVEYLGHAVDVRVHLEKCIPLGGGLGGGSSNAAATLLGLKKLYHLEISKSDLHTLAKGIGADVPFFIYNSDAMARGIGDELTFIGNGLKASILIVYPGFPISTSWAYSSLSWPLMPFTTDINMLAHHVENGNISALGDEAFNHLEGVIFSRYPLLFGIKEGLKERGAKLALMSGSGSCVFGLFTDREAIRRTEDWVRDSGWKVYRTSFV